MKRTYCDNCGTEITKENSLEHLTDLRLPTRIRRSSYVVFKMEDFHLVTEAGSYTADEPLDDVCLGCVSDALQRLDKRPKPTVAVKTLNDFPLVEIKAYLRKNGLLYDAPLPDAAGGDQSLSGLFTNIDGLGDNSENQSRPGQ